MFKENRLVYDQPGGEAPRAPELKEETQVAPEIGKKPEEGEPEKEEFGQEKAEEFVKRIDTQISGQLDSILENLRRLNDSDVDTQFRDMLTRLNKTIVEATGYQIVSFAYSKDRKLERIELPNPQIEELAKKSPNEIQKMQSALVRAYMCINTQHPWDEKLARLKEQDLERIMAQASKPL